MPPALSPLLLCSFRLRRLRRTRVKSVTAATGKGFAIGSAILTSLCLLNAFSENVEVEPAPLSVDRSFWSHCWCYASILVRSSYHAFRRKGYGLRRQSLSKCAVSSERFLDLARVLLNQILPGAHAILSPVLIGLLVGPACLTSLLADETCEVVPGLDLVLPATFDRNFYAATGDFELVLYRTRLRLNNIVLLSWGDVTAW